MQIPFLEAQTSHCYTTNVASRTVTLWFYYLYNTVAIMMCFASLVFEICLLSKRVYDKISLSLRRRKQEKGGLPHYQFDLSESTRKSLSMSSPRSQIHQGQPITVMTNKQDQQIRIHPQSNENVYKNH